MFLLVNFNLFSNRYTGVITVYSAHNEEFTLKFKLEHVSVYQCERKYLCVQLSSMSYHESHPQLL